jgi:hypothetical protein
MPVVFSSKFEGCDPEKYCPVANYAQSSRYLALDHCKTFRRYDFEAEDTGIVSATRI